MDTITNNQDSKIVHVVYMGWTPEFYQQLKEWWANNKLLHYKSLDDFLDTFPSEIVPTIKVQDLVNIWQECGMIDYSMNNKDCWIKIKKSYFIVSGICILEGDIKTLNQVIKHDLLLFLQEFINNKGIVFISRNVIRDTKSLLKYFNCTE